MRLGGHWPLSLAMMAQSLRAMNWLSMRRASLRPSVQQLIALETSFWCSFCTAMLQWISIFMQSPQWRFSQSRFRASASWHSRSRSSTSRSMRSTNTLAFRTSSSAFSCLPISLSTAALLRQVGTMSYLSQSLKSRMRASSRSMAKLTALRAIMKWRLFLRMQARLLKVRILSFARACASGMCLPVCGSITTSTALAMNLTFPPSSSRMFSIASRFTFCTNLAASAPTSKPRLTCCRSSTAKARWMSFSSQRMHSIEFSSPRSRKRPTTVQMQSSTCSSLTRPSSISSARSPSIEIIIIKRENQLKHPMFAMQCSCQQQAIQTHQGFRGDVRLFFQGYRSRSLRDSTSVDSSTTSARFSSCLLRRAMASVELSRRS